MATKTINCDDAFIEYKKHKHIEGDFLYKSYHNNSSVVLQLAVRNGKPCNSIIADSNKKSVHFLLCLLDIKSSELIWSSDSCYSEIINNEYYSVHPIYKNNILKLNKVSGFILDDYLYKNTSMLIGYGLSEFYKTDLANRHKILNRRRRR